MEVPEGGLPEVEGRQLEPHISPEELLKEIFLLSIIRDPGEPGLGVSGKRSAVGTLVYSVQHRNLSRLPFQARPLTKFLLPKRAKSRCRNAAWTTILQSVPLYSVLRHRTTLGTNYYVRLLLSVH